MPQYAIFLICAACGTAAGVLYDFFYVIRSLFCGMQVTAYTLKGKIFTGACDAVCFAAAAVLFVFCSVKFNFPDLRLYMLAAVLCGFLAYNKSFHIFIAFLVKRLYNRNTKR